MCDSDSSEYKIEQPSAKKTKSPCDTLSSDSMQDTLQSAKWPQIISVQTVRHYQDQINTRDQRKKECQRRYRERNREKLKQREAERKKRIRQLRSIGSSISTNINRMELNNIEEISNTYSENSSGLMRTQTSSVRRKKQTEDKAAIQKRRESQRRYRERNREKLKQREAERRRRLRNLESTSWNKDSTEIMNESLIDETFHGEQEEKIEIDEQNELLEESPEFLACADLLETTIKSEIISGEDQPVCDLESVAGYKTDAQVEACYSFGKYVASELLTLPIKSRLFVQQKIQSFITAAVIRNLTGSNDSETTIEPNKSADSSNF